MEESADSRSWGEARVRISQRSLADGEISSGESKCVGPNWV